MTTSYPFVTLTEMKSFLDIRPEVTKLDTRLGLLIAAATKQIEQATGRIFTRQVITEFFTTRDNRTTDYNFGGFERSNYGWDSGLATRAKPQTFYLSGLGIDRDADLFVWYDPVAMDDTAYNVDTLLDPNDDYQVDFQNDALILMIGSSYRQRALKVQYTAGFAFEAESATPNLFTLSVAIPDELKLAIMTQVQFMNVKLRSDNVGMGAERTLGTKDRVHLTPFMVGSGLTPEVSSLVRHLKRLRLGTA